MVPWSKNIKSVSIGDGITTIGKFAFRNCSDLTSVVIPNSVTSIGMSAFESCMGLTSVEIPNSVTSIGDMAFWGCSGLTSVVIPESVTSIGVRAFEYCRSIGSLEYNAVNCTSVGASWIPATLQRVTIGNKVKVIPDALFHTRTGLTSIEIPNSVTSIGSVAFYGCTGLASVSIGSSVARIGYNAFWGCTNLKKVELSDIAAWCKIEFAGGEYSRPQYYAHHLYMNGTEIKDLVIPGSVTSICDYAFRYCSGLTSVTIPSSVMSIGEGAFSGCTGLKKVEVNDIAAWCKIEFGDFYSNPLFYAQHLYMRGTEIKDLVIPNGINGIGDYAFSGCNSLTSVTIPSSVTSIGIAWGGLQ